MAGGLLDPMKRAQLTQLARQVDEALSQAQEQDDLLADEDVSVGSVGGAEGGRGSVWASEAGAGAGRPVG